MEILKAKDAFNEAIKAGLFSNAITAENYAGKWMYMFTDKDRGHAFKNIMSREYRYMKRRAA